MLDLHQHSRADEDLTRPSLIAQARCHVRHRPYSGIVKSALEADGAKRSEAVRNADAETNLVPKAAPGCRHHERVAVAVAVRPARTLRATDRAPHVWNERRLRIERRRCHTRS